AGLSAPVPPCPDWQVRDLAFHLGRLYRWVCTHASRGTTDRPETGERSVDLPIEVPPDQALIEWWDGELSALVAMLAALDPALPAWHWAPAPKLAGFWHRRMAHETAIHRWDAQVAVGQVEPIEPRLAVDGVAEVLDSWLPAGRRKGPADLAGVVQLVATDTEQEWFVRLRGEGVALLDTDTWLDHDDHQTRVLARGTGSDLVLALYGRVPFDVLETSGDVSLLAALRTG
ncbi:MAG: maleylpyruvate isomerase family mycothiol-dependent enzyme, partial [Natronosporangium sp.]